MSVITVSKTGGGMFSSPVRSIAEAINRASAGDEIRIAKGEYAEKQLIINKPLKIVGADATEVMISGSFQISSGSMELSNVSIKNSEDVGIWVEGNGTSAKLTGIRIFDTGKYGVYFKDDAKLHHAK